MESVLPASWGQLLQEAPCFVLGLERYVERSADTCCRLQKVGFQRIFLAEGVDGHARPAELEAVGEALFPGLVWKESMSPGHRGCSLGHMRLIHHIATAGIPYAVIFEDDILPHPGLAEHGPSWWAHTLEYEKEHGMLDMVFLGNQMNPEELIGKEHIHVLASPAYCLHAYVLTATGARKILNCIDILIYTKIPMRMFDIIVHDMMYYSMLDYLCWNRGALDVGWPVFSLDMPLAYVKTNDVAVWHRDTGLFYQNARWGTTIGMMKTSYLFGTADEEQYEKIKAYLRSQGEDI
jgi:GR25 family glycosyltransferase involved in LPS biosynthesis